MTLDAPSTQADFTETGEPFALFAAWLEEAERSEPNDPNAMALATVDGSGMPNVRMVLLKGCDVRGFVFYTNLESAKGVELLGSGKAALCFHWKSLRRQVRVRGPVEPVTGTEADGYFQSRPRDSRIGAWASKQSRPLESRFALERRWRAMRRVTPSARCHGRPTGRVPGAAAGDRVLAQDRPFRPHERLKFERPGSPRPMGAEPALSMKQPEQ
jgi:pyridoxamine 5'-phosphate oxidase